MTDDEQLAIIERLAWWMGYTTRRGGNCVYVSRGCVEWVSRPFDSLNDAHLLLVECYRQHIASSVVQELDELLLREYGLDAWRTEWASIETWLEWKRLTSTPEQITLAVWAVMKEQGKDGD